MARRMIHTCVVCTKPIFWPLDLRVDGGPIVALASGFAHWLCRREQVRQRARDSRLRQEQSHRRRVETGKVLAQKRSVEALAMRMAAQRGSEADE